MSTNHFNRLTPAELERLAILNEEMHESGQIIGKILRHGMESFDPTEIVPEGGHPTVNRWLLEEEIGHVIWAIRTMCLAHDMNSDRIEKHATEKGPKAEKYLHHQPAKRAPAASCCGGVGCNSCEPQGRG